MDYIASGDESSRQDDDGRWLYAMAFPIIRVDRADRVRAGLRALLPDGARYLHFYDLPDKQRVALARDAAQLGWEAALVVVQLTSHRGEERSRRRILTNALPRLEHVQHAGRVLLESRSRSDKHDRRTIDRLRGSRSLSPSFAVDHLDKAADPLTWLADLVVGAFMLGTAGDDPDAWNALDDSGLLEVTWLPRDRL